MIRSWKRNLPSRGGSALDNRVKPQVEALEDREYLAAAVSAVVVKGTLKIEGTEQRDVIRVRQEGGTLLVQSRVITTTPGQSQTLSSGLILDEGTITATWQTMGTFSAGVKKIQLDGLGGDDYLHIYSNVSAKEAEINGGAGNDTLVGVAGRDYLIGGGEADTIRVTLDFDRLIQSKGRPLVPKKLLAQQGTDTFEVDMDLGGYGRRFLQPVLNKTQQVLGLFRPFLNALNRRVPVLSDLAQKAGQPGFTFGELLDRFGGGDFQNFLNAYDDINKFELGRFNGVISLGKFTVSGANVAQLGNFDPFSEFSRSGPTQSLRRRGFNLELLERPTSAVQLMLGSRVNLFNYTFPGLQADFRTDRSYDVPTAVPGVMMQVGMGVGMRAAATASVGLDSRGLTDGKLLQGFFVSNLQATLTPRVFVTGGVAVGVPNLLEVGGLKGEGSVDGRMKFRIPGKVRLDEGVNLKSRLQTDSTLEANARLYFRYRKIFETFRDPVKGLLGAITDPGGTFRSFGKWVEKNLLKFGPKKIG